MSKLTGFNRKRIGRRNYQALIESPPTALDEYGQRSYTTGSWTTVIDGWWCELVDLGGGEILDGVQTKESTQKVAIGDSPAIKGSINSQCRATIDGVVYGIVSVRDVAGDNRSLRVEMRATE
jgi:hypothetical protein